MVSKETLEGVKRVLAFHLTKAQIERVVTDLQQVKGNRSFKDTITALYREVFGRKPLD